MNEPTKQGQLLIDLPTLIKDSAPPVVHVEPKIEIEVLPPIPRGYTARITRRDDAGFIQEFEIDPK